MDQEAWERLTPNEKAAVRDLSGLTPALVGLERHRVEVVDRFGERRRFIVGRSTGWQPCHLEVKTRRSMGGMAADKVYKSVRDLGRV